MKEAKGTKKVKKKKIIKKYGAAYVKFEGLGGFQEKFIGKLIENNIQLYDISHSKAAIYALIKPRDYITVCRTGKKYGVRVRVRERQGLYFRLYNYRRRWGLVLGALCCCGVITILSQFIWDIKISGNERVSDTEICRSLEQHGVKPGAGRLSFDTKVCELNAMLEISDLSWISVEREGSRVYVKVSETDVPEKEEIPIDAPCNIISDCDGQLISAIVRRGALQVEKGSAVRKGQLLVSGTIDDNGGNVVYVHSDADLTVRCEQLEEFYLPFVQTKKTADGEQHYSSYLLLGGFYLPLPWESYSSDSFDNIKYTEETYNISIFGIQTPFKLRKGTYTEYTEQEVKYTSRDIMSQLEKAKIDYEDNFLSECKIISADKEFLSDENGIKLTVKYVIEKNIGEKQPISILY